MKVFKILLQICLLMWKNFMLQFRRPVGTLFEIAAPILAILVILVLKFQLRDSTRSEHCFATYDPMPLQPNLNSPQSRIPFKQLQNKRSCQFTYYYTPNDNVTASIIAKIKTALDLPISNYEVNFVGVANEKDLENKTNQYFDDQNARKSTTICNTLYYRAR